MLMLAFLVCVSEDLRGVVRVPVRASARLTMGGSTPLVDPAEPPSSFTRPHCSNLAFYWTKCRSCVFLVLFFYEQIRELRAQDSVLAVSLGPHSVWALRGLTTLPLYEGRWVD